MDKKSALRVLYLPLALLCVSVSVFQISVCSDMQIDSDECMDVCIVNPDEEAQFKKFFEEFVAIQPTKFFTYGEFVQACVDVSTVRDMTCAIKEYIAIHPVDFFQRIECYDRFPGYIRTVIEDYGIDKLNLVCRARIAVELLDYMIRGEGDFRYAAMQSMKFGEVLQTIKEYIEKNSEEISSIVKPDIYNQVIAFLNKYIQEANNKKVGMFSSTKFLNELDAIRKKLPKELLGDSKDEKIGAKKFLEMQSRLADFMKK